MPGRSACQHQAVTILTASRCSSTAHIAWPRAHKLSKTIQQLQQPLIAGSLSHLIVDVQCPP